MICGKMSKFKNVAETLFIHVLAMQKL